MLHIGEDTTNKDNDVDDRTNSIDWELWEWGWGRWQRYRNPIFVRNAASTGWLCLHLFIFIPCRVRDKRQNGNIWPIRSLNRIYAIQLHRISTFNPNTGRWGGNRFQLSPLVSSTAALCVREDVRMSITLNFDLKYKPNRVKYSRSFFCMATVAAATTEAAAVVDFRLVRMVLDAWTISLADCAIRCR